MSVLGFTDIIQGALTQYAQVSQQIGGDVAQHSQQVLQAFKAQLQFLELASQSSKPANPNDLMIFLKPTSDIIAAIQDFREKHRTSTFFNHLSAISESIPALGWVAVSPAPAPYVKEMNDAGQFYTNRVLKDWKEKDKRHVDWVKAWVQTLTELQAFVKQHHTTGLVWSGKTAPSAGVPPPPPSCPLPPPPMDNFGPPGPDSADVRSALFAEINQGANITSNLKKVTSDMQTHKNPGLKQGGAAPYRGPGSNAGSGGQPDKPPVFAQDGKKWRIEYQTRNHNLVVENAEMNNVVYLYKCTECTITIRGKINSVVIDACKKTAIIMDSVVAAVEFINCQSVQMQIFGKVPTISIDKTDGCQVYLSQDSLDVEVVTSKSSEMNILIPTSGGDYIEQPIPEQFKTTITPNKTLKTIVVENKG
ncbi:adenylyl cyclase-associated protein 1-like [Anthonomus grandis grandis]|uniref:adenylyl cyclase-associated protein 1-like n=1 Tax=Anthonomus grandis grandis TaxID=2921223 RepID=UPI0021663697|nr:adenylyl cyclase-associated protein 1-like [Anthonomus grandis grandis]